MLTKAWGGTGYRGTREHDSTVPVRFRAFFPRLSRMLSGRLPPVWKAAPGGIYGPLEQGFPLVLVRVLRARILLIYEHKLSGIETKP